ncbi:MAG TPA: hypothetical protein DD738_10955 [Ruminiclostridium sp.]|jgi:hypothetical protein|nr:hypothetical protein [Ruminiclostridium sp.]
MGTVYTKANILKEVDKWLDPETVSEFYKQGFVNYRGVTSDTKEKYTEVIAEQLLDSLDALENIERITKAGPYKTPGHKWHPIDPGSPRKEEHIARSMMDHTYNGIGKIIDYQTPLKNVLSDTAGKIDLLSWNEEEGCVYLLELKALGSTETLLRCVLEIDTYSRILDSKKLLADFELPTETVLRKAVLVYQDSQPHSDFNDAKVKKLMKALGVDLFVLEDRDSVVKVHDCKKTEG